MAKLRSINPSTEEVLEEFEYINASAAIKKAETLHASMEWPSMDVHDRAKAIGAIGKTLRDRRSDLARDITLEMGKTITESIAEVEKCAWVCEYYAENGEKFLEVENIETENQKSYIALDPLGVILGVMPWNFPLWQAFRFIIPAILVGNRAMLKHASNVPQNALNIEDVCNTNLPADTFTNVFLPGKETGKLIESSVIAGVSVTGSTPVGSKVAEAAGRGIKPVVLELGGSDPFIILKDADVEEAAKTARIARFINAGQSCIAAKRFIVEKEVAGEFARAFVGHVKSLTVGDPMSEDTEIGPLARSDLRADVHSIVERSVMDGARVETGGAHHGNQGFFYQPTLLTNVTPEMPILREECFGPVAPLLEVANEEEAIKIANQTEFGLGASIWSADTEKAEQIARRIEAGFVAINAPVKSDPRLPFGGVKQSGFGRELSYLSLREFANVKTVVVK